jgi:hypothetical protein
MDVYIHDFLVVDDVLTDAQYLFDHLPPLHHDLFLRDRDQDLVVANLDFLGSLAFLNGDALHVRLFALLRNSNRFVVIPIRMVALIALTPPRAVSPKPFLRTLTVLVLGEPVAAFITSHAVPPHVQ